MDVEGYSYPSDLYYYPDHTWAKIEGGLVRVGITPYAVRLAGKIRAVTPRPAGIKVMHGNPVATLESNKWVGPLKSPVSGEIVESNSSLAEDHSPLVDDPYGEGWICVLKPNDLEADLKLLFHGDDTVKDWIIMEIHGKGK